MSALTDLFTAMANKIRSKTGTATTYTPLEMVSDGIDDVYDAGYAAGGGGVSPTSITPSDSSPASMTAGNAYEPTANGYAIASSPTSITPSTNMPALYAGTIYKPSSNGYAVSVFTPLTPSDSSPVALSAQTVYRVTNGSNGGYAIESYMQLTPFGNTYSAALSEGIYKINANSVLLSKLTNITPSDSSPVALTTDYSYKMNSAGYAIASSPTSISQSQLNTGVYFSSGIKNMAGSGYAYATQQKRTASGSVALSTSTSTKVTTGFRPKYIMAYSSSTASQGFCYNADISTTQFRFFNSSGNGNASLGSSTGNYLYSINDDGFTINKASSARTYYWFASE